MPRSARHWSVTLTLLIGACATPPLPPGEATGVVRAVDGGAYSDSAAIFYADSALDFGIEAAPIDAPEPAEASTPIDDAGTGCAGAVLCDDFEGVDSGGPPDPSRWSVVSPDCSGSGTLQIDDTQSHSGLHSMKVTGGGGYCDHVFAKNGAIAGLASTIYLRWYERLDGALGAGHVAFAAMYDANAMSDLRIGGQDGILMMNRQSDDATLPELSPTGVSLSVAPVAQAWFCLEIEIDQTHKAIAVWVDGVAIAGLVVDATPTPDVDGQWLSDASWAPKLTDLRLGWESYAGQADTLWIDDVAVSATRIGCE